MTELSQYERAAAALRQMSVPFVLFSPPRREHVRGERP